MEHGWFGSDGLSRLLRNDDRASGVLADRGVFRVDSRIHQSDAWPNRPPGRQSRTIVSPTITTENLGMNTSEQDDWFHAKSLGLPAWLPSRARTTAKSANSCE